MRKYNLGCGNDIRKGFVSIDKAWHRPEIDEAVDLNTSGWGVKLTELFGPANEILALDVIEHLNDVINFLDECWDLLVAKGVLRIKACGWQNPNYWVDPTHQRAFTLRSFDYFDPETDLGQRYGFYTAKRWRIVDKHLDRHKNVIVTMEPRKG